jgi:hypothetical protein
LLHAIVAPMLDGLQDIVEAAEQRRTAGTRAGRHACGVRRPPRREPTDGRCPSASSRSPESAARQRTMGVTGRQIGLLLAVDPGPTGRARAMFAMAGMAAAADPRAARISDKVIGDLLVEAGRRALGLRTPSGGTRNRPKVAGWKLTVFLPVTLRPRSPSTDRVHVRAVSAQASRCRSGVVAGAVQGCGGRSRRVGRSATVRRYRLVHPWPRQRVR